MKKVLLMTMAVAALTFASCGNKTDANANGDSTKTDTTAQVANDSTTSIAAGDAKAAPATVAALTKEIQAKINAKDTQGLQTLLSNAKAKITELAKTDPAQAKAYVSQLQQYINQHASEIKSIAGGNATITQAVDEVKNLNPEKVVSAIASAATTDAKNIANSAAETAKSTAEQAVTNKVNEATSAANAAKEAAETKAANEVNKAQNKANEAVNKANKKANDAVNKANKKANDAVNKATNKALKGLGL